MQTRMPGRQTQDQGSQPKAPGWVWAFVVTCGAIPIVSLEKMYESRIDFVAKHHGLTRSELDAIIEEGDEAEWWDD